MHPARAVREPFPTLPSFAVAIVEPDLFARFGSSDAVNAALRAVVEAAHAVKFPVQAKRPPRRSKRTAA